MTLEDAAADDEEEEGSLVPEAKREVEVDPGDVERFRDVMGLLGPFLKVTRGAVVDMVMGMDDFNLWSISHTGGLKLAYVSR